MAVPLTTRTKKVRKSSSGESAGTVRRPVRGGAAVSDAVLFLFSFAAFAVLISIFGPTLQMVEEHLARSKELFGRSPGFLELLDGELEVSDLPHEELFQAATMKSCLPQLDPKKCNEFVPEPISRWKKKIQRIAVISPPGLSAQLLNRKTQAIATHYNRRHGATDLDIEVIATTHVPPYGYGKTHGLTKIIRLIPQPLLLQVTDALHGVLHETEHYGMLTLDDLKTALRQVLYFHCRISHVAAHTALLSVGYDDLLRDPLESARLIHNFVTPNTPGAVAWDDRDAPDDDHEVIFETQQAWGSVLLSQLELQPGLNVFEELDKVLLTELERTQNLTSWPCPSFWTAGDDDDPTRMSLFTLRLARDMSPRCHDEYSSCFVEKDKCEAEGDVACEARST